MNTSAQTKSREKFIRNASGREARGNSLKGLSDTALLAGLEGLRGKERAVVLKILVYLREVERRRIYEPRGYSSLFDFCTGHLVYSKSAAIRRIRTARCIGRFPPVGDMLLSGELNLSVVSMVADILATENVDGILDRIMGKSFRDVELLVARHRPGGTIRDRVKPICVIMPYEEPVLDPPGASARSSDATMNPRDILSDADASFTAGAANSTPYVGCEKSTGYEDERGRTATGGDDRTESVAAKDERAESAAAEDAPAGSGAPARVERVLVTQKFKLKFVVDLEFMQDLQKARRILSTKCPNGIRLETLFGIHLKEYLDRNDPERRIQKRKKRNDGNSKRIKPGNGKKAKKEMTSGGDNRLEPEQCGRTGTGGMPDKHRSICTDTEEIPKKRRDERSGALRTRHIPRAVRDRVFVRDGGRCTFVGTDGNRCEETWNLEMDHIVPYAKGGDNSPENLRLLCPAHNRLEAEKAYGKEHMDKFYGGT